jgi:hypothetical protein
MRLRKRSYMNRDKEIIEELKEIPLLMEINRDEVYSVPPSYFDNLAGEIAERLNSDKDRAYFFGSSPSYSIPEDYFKNLPMEILKKAVKDQNNLSEVFEELEHLAPLLNTIRKEHVFSVPVDYFKTIHLPSTELHEQKTKIVSIKKRSRRLKIAAAAILIPFLAIGVYTLTSKEPGNSGNSKTKDVVKSLSKKEILNYLKKSSTLENTSSASEKPSFNDHQIKSSLKEISDKEIQQFLKETGESDEI